MDEVLHEASLFVLGQDCYRNIVSPRVSEDVFDDLSDDPDDRAMAAEWEMAVKPAAYDRLPPVIQRPFADAEWFNAIGFPFTHWATSRFSDGHFGVWYGAIELETTIHETVYHWRRRFLDDQGLADADGVWIDRKVYLVRCDAALIDLRERVEQFPELVHPTSYAATQQLGARIHEQGHPGLLTASARCDGEVTAIFHPTVLSNPRPHCYLTYRIAGPDVVVERERGKCFIRL